MDGMNNELQPMAEGAGANVQEVAAPAVETSEPVVAEETKAAELVEPAKEPQSAEVNSQFAAARRKAEEDAANQISGINNEFKRLFGDIVNPVTGKKIETYNDYLQAVEYQRKEAQNKMFQEKGIDPSVVEQMIKDSPAMRQAQQILEDNTRAEASRRLEADLKAVSEIAPDIKNLADLEKHDSYNNVLSYVQKGLGLVEAFKLANFDSLTSKSSEAAKQAAINQAKSKNHMETTSGIAVAPDSLAPIPETALPRWKMAYPDLTMEQLTKKYNESI